MSEELRHGDYVNSKDLEAEELNFDVIALLREFVRRKNNGLEDNKNGSEDSRVYH